MIFANSIKFKHGNLKRGEQCLFRGIRATYLGSYTENDHTVDMMRLNAIKNESGLVVIMEYIEQCTDRRDIVCISQQEPAIENQMQLC